MGQARRNRLSGPDLLRQRISEGDAVYLRLVRAQAQRAMQLEREAVQLDQRAEQLRLEAVALHGAHDLFVAHLCARYELNQGADLIDPESGLITRAPVVEQAEPVSPPDGAPTHGAPANGVVRP